VNRIDARWTHLRGRGEKAFIPYVTAGDPTLTETAALVRAFDEAGADIVEIGVPFSDPLADGPVNQESAMRALKHHVTLGDILAMIKQVREKSDIPILLFTYYNPVMAYGAERLAENAAAAGVDGILCVDLPPEEGDEYEAAFAGHGLRTVYLLAPTSTPDRIELVARRSTGFIYYVSRTGTTGERDSVETDVQSMVATIKEKTDTPVAVGFGIGTPAQAKQVAAYGDGVVVGSAIVRMIGELGDSPDTALQVGVFVKALVEATKGGE